MEKTDYGIVPRRAYRGNFRPYYEQYKGSTNQKTGDSMVSPEKKLKKFLLILGITGAVYGAFRYLLPLVVPFLCAYGTALFLRPSVRFLSNRIAVPFRGEMHHLPVSLVGGIELLVMSCLVFGLLYAGGSMAVSQTGLFIRRFPDWLSALDLRLTDTCRLLEQKMGLKADALVELAGRAVEEVRQMFKNSTMPVLMDRSVSALRVAVAGIVLSFIYFVAVLLTLQEMDDIREKRSRSAFRREFLVVGERIASVVSAWLKTQAFILFLTSAVCIFGLAVIGNPYSFLFGCGIGILDALPVLGAGTVLIPWGVALLFQKAWKKAAVIFGIYVVCYFLRQISEARLMGKQVGLSPLGSLVSMYVGLKLFGLSGLILGPVGVLLIGDLVRMYEEQGS